MRGGGCPNPQEFESLRDRCRVTQMSLDDEPFSVFSVSSNVSVDSLILHMLFIKEFVFLSKFKFYVGSIAVHCKAGNLKINQID